mmetsp:Transcript_4907/g.15532  ORF Transcript_4907/g.15532 Transcript_4907/m.15532 type:complete len:373 (-) Transcript_4907:2232-3350(-)
MGFKLDSRGVDQVGRSFQLLLRNVPVLPRLAQELVLAHEGVSCGDLGFDRVGALRVHGDVVQNRRFRQDLLPLDLRHDAALHEAVVDDLRNVDIRVGVDEVVGHLEDKGHLAKEHAVELVAQLAERHVRLEILQPLQRALGRELVRRQPLPAAEFLRKVVALPVRVLEEHPEPGRRESTACKGKMVIRLDRPQAAGARLVQHAFVDVFVVLVLFLVHQRRRRQRRGLLQRALALRRVRKCAHVVGRVVRRGRQSAPGAVQRKGCRGVEHKRGRVLREAFWRRRLQRRRDPQALEGRRVSRRRQARSFESRRWRGQTLESCGWRGQTLESRRWRDGPLQVPQGRFPEHSHHLRRQRMVRPRRLPDGGVVLDGV